LDINSGWDLQLDSFGPDDSTANLDAKGEMINPTRSKRTTLNYPGTDLVSWNQLTVSEQQLAELSTPFAQVEGMVDISGIGYYRTSFDLPANWNNTGATLRIAHGEDMITRVTVNGQVFDRLDQLRDELDIGDSLKAGANDIEIKIDSTLRNRISLETGNVKAFFVTGELKADVGLTGLTIQPYREVRIW